MIEGIKVNKKTKDTNHQGLTRTKLAREAGVGVETIRYYEGRGLIDPPVKAEHAHPRYSSRALDQLKFVKRAQNAGFTLKEIATLFSLGTEHCAVTKSLAHEKLETIEHQINQLQGKVDLLKGLINQCGSDVKKDKCALFETLNNKNCY